MTPSRQASESTYTGVESLPIRSSHLIGCLSSMSVKTLSPYDGSAARARRLLVKERLR